MVAVVAVVVSVVAVTSPERDDGITNIMSCLVGFGVGVGVGVGVEPTELTFYLSVQETH